MRESVCQGKTQTEKFGENICAKEMQVEQKYQYQYQN
jgi:hypothetical protein